MKSLLIFTLLFTTSTLFAGHVYYDKKTSLVWQDFKDNSKLSMTYAQAQEYCKKLKYKRYKKFKIPTMDELQTIIDYKKYNSAIKEDFEYVSNEAYWTSTPYAGEKNAVWLIHFKAGERTYKDKHYDRYIRCVQKL